MIWDMFTSPDAQVDNLHYWASVGLAHSMVGVALYLVFSLCLKVYFEWADYEEDHHLISLSVSSSAYLFLWEGGQLLQGATLSDALIDWAFVTFGAILAFSIWKGRRVLSVASILASFALIAFGVFW